MNRLLQPAVFIVLLCLLPRMADAQDPCKLLVGSQVPVIDGRSNAQSVNPGDTVCLEAGIRPLLLVKHLHGTSEKPVIITNHGGQVFIANSVNYGIKFDSCSFIVLDGSSDPAQRYGIVIDSAVGAGISVDGLSTNIAICFVEIGRTGLTGIFAKTDPDCSFNSTREKFTLRGLSIHDCYIHDTGMEGMYIGSSFYLGQVKNCNGKDTLLLPHLLKGVEVYNNLVVHTALDAIQVSSSDSGCNIHDNYILDDSYKEVLYQMGGIFIGGGSRCDCFSNTVKDGKGDGIVNFGLGNQRFYNNLIIFAGLTYMPLKNFSPYLKHGIYIGELATDPGSTFRIVNNTIVSPKSYGVFYDNYAAKASMIANNIIINPGSYTTVGEKAYVAVKDVAMSVQVTNNLGYRDYSTIGFVAPQQHNFDLLPSSPAVNKATGHDWLTRDILTRDRPFGWKNDIGAYECHDNSVLGSGEPGSSGFYIEGLAPNPCGQSVNLQLRLDASADIGIDVYDSGGKLLLSLPMTRYKPGQIIIPVDVSVLPPGIYALRLRCAEAVMIRKFIRLR